MMEDPSGFFIFYHVVKQERGGEKRYAFAYKPPGSLVRGSLDDLMLAMCRGPCLPDAAIVVGLSEDASTDLLNELRSDASRISQQRLASRIPLVHASLELKTGRVRTTLLDRYFSGIESDLKKLVTNGLKNWMQSGLLTAFNPDDVILRAPAGYMYEKPSGARSALFLKPDLALKSSAIVSFVATCVFCRFFSRRTSSLSDLSTIYVDTMAVSSVAYALRELLALCKLNSSPHIESFHSYDGFDEIRRPLRGTSFCIISASASMALHKKWVDTMQVPTDEVVTLITLASAGHSSEQALLAIAPPEDPVSSGPVQLSIRIKGETFLPEQEPPKKVLLRDAIHRSNDEVKNFHLFSGRSVFDIYRSTPQNNSKPRALFVDGGNLIAQPEFLNWIHGRLHQSVKAATRCIIYQGDPSSFALAKLIGTYCRDSLGLDDLRLISTMDLSDAEIEPDIGVIVCAAVVGKGSQLLEVSRALRDRHSGPRLYLVGFQVSEARSELQTLASNLKHSKGLVQHDVAVFGKAATGTTLGSSFASEMSDFYGTSYDFSALPRMMQKRAASLGSTSSTGSLTLLPSGGGVDKALALRAGFAFWPAKYDPGPCHPEVLATIAVLLQRAREEDKLADEHRLGTTSFRHVVLDPENFTRYNDGVIQAALLRCAYPSELDYRSDHASSDFMKSLILRSLSRAASETGEGVLEFLLALTQRRLQLSDAHLGEITAATYQAFSRRTKLGRAIAFVLPGPQSMASRKTKLPF